MQVARYFASLGFNVSDASIKKVDKSLDNFERRIRKFGKIANKPIKLNIQSFGVDQTKLTLALGTALDAASKRVTFEVSRFVVNDRNLLAALLRAARRLPPVPPGPNPPGPRPHPGPYPPDYRGGHRGSAATAGFFAGGASRLLGPALALGFGGYGLSQLNQRNQQVVSAQLQSQAVVQQAGGTAAQGSESFQYLRNEGNRIGFNYLEASGDYNKLISGLTGSGVSLGNSQKVFSGFAELARTNKLDKTTQNRLFRALSQVAGKGKLQSEELVGQISEALPGGTALFAQAYQRQIGGNKTGSEAIQQLLADMKKGKVTSDILTYAGAEASTRANAGGALGLASQASQAEQGRFQNAVSDTAILASNNGVEEGFARIFRTLTDGLNESNGLVKTLAEGFNQATIETSKLLLFPQSFIRALEGRDSLVADWLGVDQVKELQSDWAEIKISLDSILGLKTPEWFSPLKEVAQELKDLIAVAGGISQKYRETKQVAEQIQLDSIDEYGGTVGGVIGLAKANYFTLASTLGLGEQGLGYGLNKVKNTLPFGNSTPVSGLVGQFADYLSTPNDTVAKYYVNRDKNLGLDVDTMYGADGAGWRDFNAQRNLAGARDLFGPSGYSPSQSSANAFQSSADSYKQGTSQSTVNENKFDVNVVLQSGDPDEISNYFKTQFQSDIDTAMLHFEEK